MIIAVDFDGTCVTHDFPKVGKDIGAVPVLKQLVADGHKLILWTMRSDNRADGGNYLQDAVDWFKDNGIELWGIQRNPEQDTWTSSPKAYAQLYIDDAALGCPLLTNKEISDRPYVNWLVVSKHLFAKGIIRNEPIGSEMFLG